MIVLTKLDMNSNQISNSGFENLTTLPNSNLFKGRLVFNTTDNMYYQYNGTKWIALVDLDILNTSIESKFSESVGKNVTGEKYTINNVKYTAGSNAEIFNDYKNNKSIGVYSHTEGGGTVALGLCSHAEGNITTASGVYSHAEGVNTTSSGPYSHAEGSSTKATNNGSHAEGGNTTASGKYSHTEGTGTTASGHYSHAEGGGANASGIQSHAEGAGTTASGAQSHAEGGGTIASEDCSHAEGSSTTASGAYSHAEGSKTITQGLYSHAEGNSTVASGSCSHAEGLGTKAASANQHVQGKYNVEDSANKFSFIIGNGTADSSGNNISRSNAFAIDWEGKIYVNNSPTGIQLFPNVDLTLDEYNALSNDEKNNGTYYNIIES